MNYKSLLSILNNAVISQFSQLVINVCGGGVAGGGGGGGGEVWGGQRDGGW